MELKRSVNLFYIPSDDEKKEKFNLNLFFSCAFQNENELLENINTLMQPAFSISSLQDLFETSLRKRFRKRRLTTFPFSITKQVAIGVELYALKVIQKKTYPISLEASTNLPLKTESKWLCEDTGRNYKTL